MTEKIFGQLIAVATIGYLLYLVVPNVSSRPTNSGRGEDRRLREWTVLIRPTIAILTFFLKVGVAGGRSLLRPGDDFTVAVIVGTASAMPTPQGIAYANAMLREYLDFSDVSQRRFALNVLSAAPLTLIDSWRKSSRDSRATQLANRGLLDYLNENSAARALEELRRAQREAAERKASERETAEAAEREAAEAAERKAAEAAERKAAERKAAERKAVKREQLRRERAVGMISNSFRVSSFQGSSGGGVEVRLLPDGNVALRDAKDISKPYHTFTAAEWSGFLAGVRSGEFDLG